MQPTDGTVILCTMVVAAIAITLVYDLTTNVRRAPRRPSRPAPEPGPLWITPLVQATIGIPPLARPVTPTADLQRLTVSPLAMLGMRTDAPTSPTSEVDPLRELTARLTALRLIGLDHLRDVHPLFRMTVDQPGLFTPAAALPLAPTPEPEAAAARPRSRRRRPNPLTLVRATGQLRLVSDTTRR